MDAKTLQGIVYLVLLCAGGAGLWIFVLYQVLGRTRQRVAEPRPSAPGSNASSPRARSSAKPGA